MSNSVRPHRRPPTRLLCPWDSPGKNTGVGCHFLLQCMKVKSEKWKWSLSVVSDRQWTHGLQPSRLLRPLDFPGKITGVGCHFLLQCMKVKSESEVSQSCLTLSDPMDCSPPGSSDHGIFQARVLDWGAIAFSDLFTKAHLFTFHLKQLSVLHTMPYIVEMFLLKEYIQFHSYTFIFLLLTHNTHMIKPLWYFIFSYVVY